MYLTLFLIKCLGAGFQYQIFYIFCSRVTFILCETLLFTPQLNSNTLECTSATQD